MHLSEPGCRNPVEVRETTSPMFIESSGHPPATGGPGRHRSDGVSRVYRFMAPSSRICLVDKTKTNPWAIGGRPGAGHHIGLDPGTGREVVRGGGHNHLDSGDVVVNDTGGYADPFEREPEPARDARIVSVRATAYAHGVADTLQIDAAPAGRPRREPVT